VKYRIILIIITITIIIITTIMIMIMIIIIVVVVVCGTWWRFGWVNAFRLKGQVLHSQLHVAFRRETLAQYLCCVRSTSE